MPILPPTLHMHTVPHGSLTTRPPLVACGRYGMLTQLSDLREQMSPEQRTDYLVPLANLTATLYLCVFAVIVVMFVVLGVLTRVEAEKRRMDDRVKRARRLRRNDDNSEVTAPSIDRGHFHLFLSHSWSSGQDQMRVVKQRLIEMLPDLHVFLDVDDLAEGRGAEYVDRSSTVLIFLSDGYFESANCMRELLRAMYDNKPIITLHETSVKHGGLTLKDIETGLEGVPRLLAATTLGAEIKEWGCDFLDDGFQCPSLREMYEQLVVKVTCSHIALALAVAFVPSSHCGLVHCAGILPNLATGSSR